MSFLVSESDGLSLSNITDINLFDKGQTLSVSLSLNGNSDGSVVNAVASYAEETRSRLATSNHSEEYIKLLLFSLK